MRAQGNFVLTNGGGGGIMNSGSDDVALEYQRYGRNKDTVINNSYIESGEYRNKFDKLTNNKEINRVLYSKAKEMLKHRSGTCLEDMYWIDGDTGAVVASALNEKSNGAISYSESISKAISGKKNLITMHTHPQSMPPSMADFNSAYIHGYKNSIIFCHDGKIFEYRSNQKVNERLCELYSKEFKNKGFSKFDSQLKALEKIRENHDIYFREVK